MEIYCIDRFEGDIVVCEDENRRMLKLHESAVYDGAREGDWFELVDGKPIFSKELTLEKRNINLKLLNELME